MTETSIGQLFIAGIVPGLIMLTLFAIYVYFTRPRILVTHAISSEERWK